MQIVPQGPAVDDRDQVIQSRLRCQRLLVFPGIVEDFGHEDRLDQSGTLHQQPIKPPHVGDRHDGARQTVAQGAPDTSLNQLGEDFTEAKHLHAL